MRTGVLRMALWGLLAILLSVPGAGWGTAQQQKPPQPPPEQQQQQEYVVQAEVPLVNVDVVVADNNGNFLSGLKKENFRVLVDNQPQQITNFATTEAPITVVLLLEFSKLLWGWFYYETPADNATFWAYQFLNELKKDDWVALVTFDLKTRIEADFTRDKYAVGRVLARMYVPGFSEANLFDALIETLDRLQDVKGKKSILILATGFDTFSKHTLDDTLKRVRQTDVTIFAVGVARNIMERADAYGAISGPGRVQYYQAENQLNSFARITGGRAWFPQFDGQIPGIVREVAAMLRNQYSLAFIPPQKVRDGKFHKIKVEVVGDDGQPLVVVNQKGKRVKFAVFAREGFVAPKSGVAD